MKNILLIAISVIVIISCSEQNTPQPNSNSSNMMDVYANFSINGKKFDCSETIDLDENINAVRWGVSNFDGIESTVYLSYISPQDGIQYQGFLLTSGNGTVLKQGSNPNCELILQNGNITYTSTDITINISHVASSVKDYYEGTFTGIVTETDISNFPGTVEDYPASGSFKVPLW